MHMRTRFSAMTLLAFLAITFCFGSVACAAGKKASAVPGDKTRFGGKPKLAKTVTRHDITWTFDKLYPTGTFLNGDPWVLGPVTITAVSPDWDGEVHGSQVDPAPSKEQGFRTAFKFGPKYNDTLRAKFPLKLSGVKSLVSTVGMKPQKIGGAYEAFETASVLTVVDKIPAPKSFRPAPRDAQPDLQDTSNLSPTSSGRRSSCPRRRRRSSSPGRRTFYCSRRRTLVLGIHKIPRFIRCST